MAKGEFEPGRGFGEGLFTDGGESVRVLAKELPCCGTRTRKGTGDSELQSLPNGTILDSARGRIHDIEKPDA